MAYFIMQSLQGNLTYLGSRDVTETEDTSLVLLENGKYDRLRA